MNFAMVAIFGLCFGSFINAVVWRLDTAEAKFQAQASQKSKAKGRKPAASKLSTRKNAYSIFTGRSMCPNCRHVLSGKELVPILSWLWLRGRCRWCSKPISLQYPLVEALTAILFGLSYLAWEFDGIITVFSFGLWLLILTSLVALSVYDLKHMLLPTKVVKVTIALVWIQLLLVALADGDFGLIATHLLAALAGCGFFYALYAVSRGKWLGGGDVRLVFAMGLLLGPKLLLLAFFIAFNSAAIVSIALIAARRLHRKALIPFGPFLIAGTVAAMLWGEIIIDAYLRLVLFT